MLQSTLSGDMTLIFITFWTVCTVLLNPPFWCKMAADFIKKPHFCFDVFLFAQYFKNFLFFVRFFHNPLDFRYRKSECLIIISRPSQPLLWLSSKPRFRQISIQERLYLLLLTFEPSKKILKISHFKSSSLTILYEPKTFLVNRIKRLITTISFFPN